MANRHGGSWLRASALLGGAIVLAAALGWQMTRRSVPAGAMGSPGGGASASQQAARRELWQKAQAHLDWANAQSLAQIDPALDGLGRFFTQSLDGVGPFARDALGLEGKLQYLRGAAGDGASHREYLRQRFEQRIFSADQLRQAIEGCVVAHASSLSAVDNQLLVRLRADVADMPTDTPLADLDPTQMDRALAGLLAAPAGAVSRDVRTSAAREACSAVAGELAGAVAVRVASSAAARLGVSGGLLTAGAGTSWASLGTSLAAAMLVDRGIDWAMQRAGYAPQDRLGRVVAANLLDLKALLIEGDADVRLTRRRLGRLAHDDPDASVRAEAAQAMGRIDQAGYSPGLRCELEELARRHDQARRQMLREAILGSGL